jgi:hypothetical protein
MTPTEVADALQKNIDKRLRITFDDGIIQSVSVHSVDQEGFLHSGPDGTDPTQFWTRFEGVKLIEIDSTSVGGIKP